MSKFMIKLSAWLLAIAIFAGIGVLYLSTKGFDGGYTTYITIAEKARDENDLDTAYKYYMKAADALKNNPTALIDATNVLVSQGKIDKAVELMEDYISKRNASAAAYDQLIMLYENSDADSEIILAILEEASAKFGKTEYADKAAQYRAGINTVEAPCSSVDSGKYSDELSVTLSHTDSECYIYYTTDGSTPDNTSDLYIKGKNIEISSDTVLKIIAYNTHGASSLVVTYTYYIGTEDTVTSHYAGNTYNGGIAAYYENYIFYSKDGRLYRSDFDGSNSKVIARVTASSINVSSGTVYYINDSDSSSIYSCELDGDNNICIIADKASLMQVAGNQIYYINESDGASLYRAELNGGEITCLESNAIAQFSINNNLIYFVRISDGILYSMDIDSSSKTVVLESTSTSATCIENRIYYIDISNSRHLCVLSDDGDIITTLVDASVSEMVVSGNYIFYTLSTSSGLYRIETDGSGNTVLANVSCGNLSAVGEYIYYTNYTDGELCKIAMDASEKSIVK